MKTIFIFILLSQLVFSQTEKSNYVITSWNGNGSIEAKAPSKGDTEGSMYLNEEFSAIKVGGELQIFLGRYNAFNDRMELSDNNKEYVYYPNLNDKEFHIINLNKKYIYLKYYIDEKKVENGYLVEIIKDEISLYKKEKVKLVEGKVSETGYDKTRADKYVKQKDVFYFQIKDSDIIKVPQSKKEFSKHFKSKEEDIFKFIKDNKYSLSDESDLKKVFTYINKLNM